MKRPTITDIAQQAGVTKAAVSFALNGQPGVSAATRERILAIAEEIGFQPSSAARALTAGKAGAFGLVITLVSLAAHDYFFGSGVKRAFFENLTNLKPIDRKASLRQAIRQASDIIELGKTVP